MVKSGTLLAFSAALLVGCAGALPERGAPEPIVNEQGHVVGHRDVKLDVPVYYTPRYDAKEVVVAYEEPVPEGAVIRSLDGTNQNNEGVTVTVPREDVAK